MSGFPFSKGCSHCCDETQHGVGVREGTGVRCGEDIWPYKDASFLRKLKLSSRGKAGIMWLFLYSRAAAEKKSCVWLPKLSLKQLEFTAELRDC